MTLSLDNNMQSPNKRIRIYSISIQNQKQLHYLKKIPVVLKVEDKAIKSTALITNSIAEKNNKTQAQYKKNKSPNCIKSKPHTAQRQTQISSTKANNTTVCHDLAKSKAKTAAIVNA